MLFPGIKKVKNYFNLQDDGTFVFGTVKNSYIRLCDGHNCKILLVNAPEEISDQTREAVKKFSDKPYKAKIQINTKSITFTFTEILTPYSWKKICEIIEGCTQIIYNANPELKADTSTSESSESTSIAKKATNPAKVLVEIIGIIAIIFAVSRPFISQEYKSAKFASGMAQAMNAECPVQMEGITLEKVESKRNKIYLNYTFTFDTTELDENASQLLKDEFIKNLKDNGVTGDLFEQKIWFFLIYHDLDGKELFQIRIVPIDYK